MTDRIYPRNERLADNAWRSGYLAFLNNYKLNENTYNEFSEEEHECWIEWRNGWYDAEIEYSDNEDFYHNNEKEIIYDEY